MVCSTERITPFPFDVHHRNIVKYDVASSSDFKKLGNEITERLTALLKKQRSIETIESLKPAAKTQGLTPHEISVLALIMAQFDSPGLSASDIRRSMLRAGYTEVATGLAVEKLKRSEYIEILNINEENYDQAYLVWALTIKAKNWLLANEDQLNLREKPEKGQSFSDSDIPF